MGNWSLTIQGLGICHNGMDCDADAIGREVVKALRKCGQQNVKGYFCYGIDIVDDIVEKMLPHGEGHRRALPLLPLCTSGPTGNEAANPYDACGKSATHGKRSADIYFGFACKEHAESMPDEHKHLLEEL